MIKVTGGGKIPAGRSAKPAAGKTSVSGSFRVADAVPAGAAPTALAEAGPTAAIGALIALQGEGGGKARSQAAAERAIALLDRLRVGLLGDGVTPNDLQQLADVATAKIDDADPALAVIFSEIALRARVELAKFGR